MLKAIWTLTNFHNYTKLIQKKMIMKKLTAAQGLLDREIEI